MHFRSCQSNPILVYIQSCPGWRVRTVSSGKHFFQSTVCTGSHPGGDAKMNPSAQQADLIAFMKKKWERTKISKSGPSSLCHKNKPVLRIFTHIQSVATLPFARGDWSESPSTYSPLVGPALPLRHGRSPCKGHSPAAAPPGRPAHAAPSGCWALCSAQSAGWQNTSSPWAPSGNAGKGRGRPTVHQAKALPDVQHPAARTVFSLRGNFLGSGNNWVSPTMISPARQPGKPLPT